MSTIKRFFGLVSLVGSFVLLSFVALPAPSVAAASSCQVAPSEANCTGQDPQVTGCEADAYTIATAEALGKVRAAVRYSPTCRSAWARGVNLSNLSGSRVTAQIVRSDGRTYAKVAYYPTTAVPSQMVFIGNGLSARALATLQNSSGTILSQVQTGFVRP